MLTVGLFPLISLRHNNGPLPKSSIFISVPMVLAFNQVCLCDPWSACSLIVFTLVSKNSSWRCISDISPLGFDAKLTWSGSISFSSLLFHTKKLWFIHGSVRYYAAKTN